MSTADQRVHRRNHQKRRNRSLLVLFMILTVIAVPVALWQIPYPSNLAVAIPLVAVSFFFTAAWRS